MRIAVYHNLPSGGAKRTLYESARRLASRHVVKVFTTSSADHEFADLRPVVADYRIYPFTPSPLYPSPFGRINQFTRWQDLRRLTELSGRIAADINHGGFDVLLAEPCQFETCPSVIPEVHIPTVYYCHEPLRRVYEAPPPRPYDGARSAARRLLDKVDPLPTLYFNRLKSGDRERIQFCDRVLVNSMFMRESVSSLYGVNAEIAYHGVDTELFRPVSVLPERFIFSVGSLTPMKGFDFLIEAVARIPQGDRPPLAVASNFQNSAERTYLEQLAERLQVDLRLLTNVTDQRLVELYNQASVVAYAPIREPFGLVPLEAMACGKSIIGVSEGGIPETVVHEQTGLLAPRDPERFAAELQRLLNNPSLAQDYGRQGRARALKHWTWEVAGAKLERQLLESSRCLEECPQ